MYRTKTWTQINAISFLLKEVGQLLSVKMGYLKWKSCWKKFFDMFSSYIRHITRPQWGNQAPKLNVMIKASKKSVFIKLYKCVRAQFSETSIMYRHDFDWRLRGAVLITGCSRQMHGWTKLLSNLVGSPGAVITAIYPRSPRSWWREYSWRRDEKYLKTFRKIFEDISEKYLATWRKIRRVFGVSMCGGAVNHRVSGGGRECRY